MVFFIDINTYNSLGIHSVSAEVYRFGVKYYNECIVHSYVNSYIHVLGYSTVRNVIAMTKYNYT